MLLFFIVSVSLSVAYIYLLLWMIDGWDNTGTKSISESNTTVSIIIAARNEAQNIQKCLQSIKENNYPSDLVEIIVVDDHSEDDTAKIVTDHFPEVVLIYLDANEGKKEAVKLASQRAKGELLLFTDADCIVPTQWIATIVSNYDSESCNFIAAPVMIDLQDNLISRFQFLDVAATMAVTANGIQKHKYYSANGANMAISRDAFIALYDFRKDESIASGDDMFAIQYLAKQDPSKILFVKSIESTVTTKGEVNLRTFISQRIRWAGKSKYYEDKNIIYIQGFVFILVCCILINILLGIFTNSLALWVAGAMLFIKTVTDYLFLSYLCRFYDKKEATNMFLISAALYNAYILFAGLVALWPLKYKWKGREVV